MAQGNGPPELEMSGARGTKAPVTIWAVCLGAFAEEGPETLLDRMCPPKEMSIIIPIEDSTAGVITEIIQGYIARTQERGGTTSVEEIAETARADTHAGRRPHADDDPRWERADDQRAGEQRSRKANSPPSRGASD